MISVLCANKDSIYKSFPNLDVWDSNRNAYNFNGSNQNGGVLEHPAGSSFFSEAGIPKSKIYSVDQHWFGFPCRKRTYLFFNKCKPVEHSLRFDAIEKTVDQLHSSRRSDTTKDFAAWLIKCVSQI